MMTFTVRSIGEIVRDGIYFDIKNWSDELMTDHNLLETADTLFALLAIALTGLPIPLA